MHIVTDEACMAYHRPGHPEGPERIRGTLKRLRSQKDLPITWLGPAEVDETVLLRAHSPQHLDQLKLPIDFDGDTPAYPGIARHARRSVGGALQALRCAMQGRAAFSLLRPPGHHAEREQAMGFCYLNSVAIAVLEALAAGVGHVAVYDFDLHHGNGTESILIDNPRARYVSIHQSPGYPGTGLTSRKNCFNFPMPPRSPRSAYRDALSEGLDAIRQWKPDLLAVSAGFDAFRGDPLGAAPLEIEDFQWLGRSLRDLDVPVFCVLEGGYSDELPELILAFLKGFEGRAVRPI